MAKDWQNGLFVSCKKVNFKNSMISLKFEKILQSSARKDEKPPDKKKESAEDDEEADDPPGRQIPLHVGSVAFEGDVEGCCTVDE